MLDYLDARKERWNKINVLVGPHGPNNLKGGPGKGPNAQGKVNARDNEQGMDIPGKPERQVRDIHLW